MTPRERVLTTLRRQIPDKVPRELIFGGFTPALMEIFKFQTGVDDHAEYFNYEVRPVDFAPPVESPLDRFARYFSGPLPKGTWVTDWGVARVPVGHFHFTRMVHPMAEFTTVNELDEYPFPDFGTTERNSLLRQQVDAFHDRDLAVEGELYQTIFEVAWGMRGMESLLSDFYLNPGFADDLLDRVTAIRCDQARRLVQAGVDILRLGDDVAQQTGLMMSPGMWRKWLKPRLASVIEAARSANPDLLIFYHSDGDVENLIPELIEVGVDILNPIQPECMDPVRIKQAYGDRLAFWGTIGTQSVMPFGTAEDVKRTVKRMIETVGEGGGLLLSPTHMLEPEVPWENVLAFFDAVDEFGYYRD